MSVMDFNSVHLCRQRRKYILASTIIVLLTSICYISLSYHKLNDSRKKSKNVPYVWNSNIGVIDTKNQGSHPVTLHEDSRVVLDTDLTSLSDNKNLACMGRGFEWQAEDILCLNRPQYLPNYKNPCFNDSGEIRCLPYFHLLGADKCGSTDLFDRILKHPEMERCDCFLGKESFYWSWTRYGIWLKQWNGTKKSLFRQYLHSFDHPANIIHKNERDGYHTHITGDGTPMDLWDFRGWQLIPQNEGLDEPKVLTPHLMRHMYANPKFLVILRNPTDRLYSDYYFLKYGTSADTFHEHTIQALAVIKECFSKHSVTHCLYSPQLYKDLPMRIHIGCYAVFLKEWFSVFPRESFLFLRTEDYHVKNKEHLHKVFKFLTLRNLPDSQMTEISGRKKRRVTKSKRNASPMRKDTRVILDNFYSSYNRQLVDLIHDKRFLWEDNV